MSIDFSINNRIIHLGQNGYFSYRKQYGSYELEVNSVMFASLGKNISFCGKNFVLDLDSSGGKRRHFFYHVDKNYAKSERLPTNTGDQKISYLLD